MTEFMITVAGVAGLFILIGLIVALMLLDRMADATERIAEIMRRSHAQDLADYERGHPDAPPVPERGLTMDQPERGGPRSFVGGTM